MDDREYERYLDRRAVVQGVALVGGGLLGIGLAIGGFVSGFEIEKRVLVLIFLASMAGIVDGGRRIRLGRAPDPDE